MSDFILIVLTILLLYKNGICDGRKNVTPRVTTPLGQIEGYVGLTVNSKPFYKFEGVPYAKPPVGNLRFENPQGIKPWKGIRNAKVLTQCMQYDHLTKDSQNNYVIHGDEDCLHVNIYTHTTKRTANLNVLFHIHGGAYSFGSGGSYGPEIIMDRNIVFINMNYRLGPLAMADEILFCKGDPNILRDIAENIKKGFPIVKIKAATFSPSSSSSSNIMADEVLFCKGDPNILRDIAENIKKGFPIVKIKAATFSPSSSSSSNRNYTEDIESDEDPFVDTESSLSVYEPSSYYSDSDSEILNPEDRELSFPQKIRGTKNVNSVNSRTPRTTKKHCCLFCGILVTKLPRHLEIKHFSETDVQKALDLEKASLERKRAWLRIQKLGDYAHLQSQIKNNIETKNIITLRRLQHKQTPSLEDYAVCPKCKGIFTRKNLKNHVREMCDSKKRTSRRTILPNSRLLTLTIHPRANELVRRYIFSVMRDDFVVRSISNDNLVVMYANYATLKFRSSLHHYKMIRHEIRHLGDILKQVRTLNKEITDLTSMYSPQYFDDVVKAIQIDSGFDTETGKYRAPTRASSACALIQKVGDIAVTVSIRNERPELQLRQENFLNLLKKLKNALINKTAIENLTQNRRQKKVLLPKTDVVNQFFNYINAEIKKYYSSLCKTFDEATWITLSKLALVHIMLFNRRRPGEIERTFLFDYSNLGEVNKEFISTLPPEEKQYASNFCRFIIRGKLNRPVPVILHSTIKKSLDLILHHREKLDISSENQYLFAKPSQSQLQQYFHADLALKQFLAEGRFPTESRITATNLRKHLATVVAGLHIDDDKLTDVVDFMGHHVDIHKRIYRQMPVARDVINMGQILMTASGAIEDDFQLKTSEAEPKNLKVEIISNVLLNKPNLATTILTSKKDLKASPERTVNDSPDHTFIGCDAFSSPPRKSLKVTDVHDPFSQVHVSSLSSSQEHTVCLSPDKISNAVCPQDVFDDISDKGPNDSPDVLVEESFNSYTDKASDSSLAENLQSRGFISTEDDVLPGNIGLKDQIKALKWVKKYIKYFGGNPEAITIYGFSAGAASVHLHYLMPASKGLFKNGFSQSGSVLNSWVLVENIRERTAKVANLVGCPTNNSAKFKKCLKTKPARDIIGTMREFQPFLYNPFSPFGVVVDGKWAKKPTLPDHPYKLLKQGKVQDLPWMISHTRDEGVYPGADFWTDERLLEIDTRWNELLPFLLDYNYTIDPNLRDEVSQTIRQEYFQNKPVNKDTFSTLIDVLSDRMFLADIEKAARLHSSVVKSNVFSYAFNHKGSASFAEIITGTTQNLGVSHGDDVLLTLKLPYNFTKSELSTAADKQISKLLNDMIVSFMKEGSPNITTIWEPLSKNYRDPYRVLQINRYDDLLLLQKKHFGRSPFWDGLPFQENDKNQNRSISTCQRFFKSLNDTVPMALLLPIYYGDGGAEEEISFHILAECDALGRLKHNIFGVASIALDQLQELNWAKILSLIRGSGWPDGQDEVGICDGVENVMPSVTTPLGQIEGYVGLTVNSNPFYKFEGVPYAKPPVGELRFEDPEDIEPWTGIRNATVLTQCMQYDQFTKDSQNNYVVHGDEDCLHVNIYTHTTKRTANIDVLFHIHGGAYSYGSGGGYGPEIIMDRNIVFVNMNYRLGPLGFTSTEDDVLPGNIGLKDQIKALKWVKKYIKYFGGNPEAITIYGFSAGAASVHLHYLIPASKGLFKKGFSQSGSALNPWVLAENTREKTAKVADLVGCPANNSTEIKECLKTKPARDIVGTMRAFQPFLYNPFSPFGVVVDGKWAKNPTLPDHPYKLIKQGKVQDLPWIISHTRNEGVYPGGDFLTDERLLEIDTRWNELLPFILDYNYTIDPILKDVVSQKIRQEYFQNEPVNNDTFSTLRDVLTDRIFLADIEKAARLHSSVVKSNVFSYAFYYKGTDSFAEVLTGSTQNLGVSHGDDVLLILKLGYNFTKSELSTEADKLTSKLLIDTIISFMKEGSPNITTIWEPLSKNPRDDYRELQINRYDDLQLLPKKYIGRSPFWDSLPFQENDKLFKVKNNV